MSSTPQGPSLTTGSAPPVATIGGLPLDTGDHLCLFYRGRRERDRLMVSYLREGLRAGQRCICIADSGEHRRLVSAVTKDGVDARLLEVTDPGASYLRSGTFVAEDMLDFWREWAAKTFDKKGSTLARVAADMSWAESLVSSPSIGDLTSYEARFTRFARSYPQVVVCMYDLDRFGGNVVIPVLKVHPKVWMSGVVVKNPYYLEAHEILPDQALPAEG